MEVPDFRNPELPRAARARDLVGRLTRAEKIAQMMHRAPAIPRLGIEPCCWLGEALHGVARAGIATVFPQAIGLAATFDPGLLARVGRAIGIEGRAKHHAHAAKGDRNYYTGLTFFAPNINIVRDPRWGRSHETYGECPYLTGRLAAAFIRGVQGHESRVARRESEEDLGRVGQSGDVAAFTDVKSNDAVIASEENATAHFRPTLPGMETGIQGYESRVTRPETRDYLLAGACAKHYAVHSGPEAQRHHFDARVSLRDLHETYLPAFRACAEAGVVFVMTAYNRTLGEACSASGLLLDEILRRQWGYPGAVVSDWGAINDIWANHKLVETPAEAAAAAVKHGCDLELGEVYQDLGEALEKGLLREADLDVCLRRLFELRLRLGEFDPSEKVPHTKIPWEKVDCPEHQKLAAEAARKSVVLLKNNGILPLPRTLRSIAVIGPNADCRETLWGNYHGTPKRTVTPLEGLRASFGEQVFYAPGCDIVLSNPPWNQGKHITERTNAILAAERADAVVLCLGLAPGLEGEEGDANLGGWKGDRRDIRLPEIQRELFAAVAGLGKPIILVLISGSNLAIPEEAARADAVIQQFYPGQAGGAALAEVIFGDYNPAGRLPVTFYRAESDLPDFEDYALPGRTYRYFAGEPLFPFGFGLSYSQFTYAGLRAPDRLPIGENLMVSVELTNQGPRAGDEVVQAYLSRETAPLPGPRFQLAGVERRHLAVGEKQLVEFSMTPRQLALVNEAGRHVLPPHRLRVHVGPCQPDPVSCRLSGVNPLVKEIELIGPELILPI